MKELEGDEKGAKLCVLKDLLATLKESKKEKLPKGKGFAMLSVSASKPEPKTTDELAEEPSVEFEQPKQDFEKPDFELAAEEAEDEETEEAPEHEAEESSEEEKYENEFSEPKIPNEIMEIVKLMLSKKGK